MRTNHHIALSALAGAALSLAASIWIVGSKPALAQDSRRFKYDHDLITQQELSNPRRLNEELNKRGQEGWEMVNVVVLQDRTVAIYKMAQ